MQQRQIREENRQLSWHFISVALPVSQYRRLLDLLAASKFRSKGELMRHILNRKAVVAVYYSESLNDILSEVAAVERELETYSGSIRRLARSLYTIKDPEIRLSYVQTAVSVYQETIVRLPVLRELLSGIAVKLDGAG